MIRFCCAGKSICLVGFIFVLFVLVLCCCSACKGGDDCEANGTARQSDSFVSPSKSSPARRLCSPLILYCISESQGCIDDRVPMMRSLLNSLDTLHGSYASHHCALSRVHRAVRTCDYRYKETPQSCRYTDYGRPVIMY